MRRSSSRESANRHGITVTRATVQDTNDDPLLQELTLNGFNQEASNTIEHAHPYGFVQRVQKPQNGKAAEAFMIHGVSNRSHGLAMPAADRRYRLRKLQPGEVAVHDDQGQWFHLKRGGALLKVPNGNTVTIQVDQSSGGGGGGGGSQQYGQDATQVPSPVATIKATKNGVTVTVGDATLFVANDFIVGHVNSDSRVVVNSAGTKIKKGANVIFVDGAGCWSTSAINIKADSIPDGSDPT